MNKKLILLLGCIFSISALFGMDGQGTDVVIEMDALEELARPEVQNTEGMTPLMIAARYGHVDVCKALLDAGTVINPDYKSGSSMSLYRVAQSGDVEVVRALLDAGAKIEEAHTDELDSAFQNGDLALVCELLDKGAEVNAPNKYGSTPLDAGAEINPDYKSGSSTSLFRAAQSVDVEVVKALLESGAEINTPNKYGQTPLFEAARQGMRKLNVLVDAGANKEAQDHTGELDDLYGQTKCDGEESDDLYG